MPDPRSEAEIRRELQRIAEWSGGSYEELAGAARALAWVLGEGDETVIPRDLHVSQDDNSRDWVARFLTPPVDYDFSDEFSVTLPAHQWQLLLRASKHGVEHVTGIAQAYHEIGMAYRHARVSREREECRERMAPDLHGSDSSAETFSSRARCSECDVPLVFSGYDCGDDDPECECDECSYCPRCEALYVFPCDAHINYYPGRKVLPGRAF